MNVPRLDLMVDESLSNSGEINRRRLMDWASELADSLEDTSVAAQVLADGQVSNAQGPVYTVPQGKTAKVIWFKVSNPTGGVQSASWYIHRVKSTARFQAQAVLNPSEHADFIDISIELNAGDTLEAVASAAGTIDFTILGNETIK